MGNALQDIFAAAEELTSDITEAGNVWRQDRCNLALPEDALSLVDEDPPAESGWEQSFWVAPMAASMLPARRKGGSSSPSPLLRRSWAQPSEVDNPEDDILDSWQHYLQRPPDQVVIEPGEDDPRVSRRAHLPRAAGRGWASWIPLKDCKGLSKKVLLTPSRLTDLHPFLPLTVRLASCFKLIYCPRVHGVSLRTFYRQCQAWPGETLILIEDARGAVFGGFASVPWQVSRQRLHFGTPDCFIFTYGLPEDHLPVSVFPWAGRNQCFMFADRDGFSMGGGPEGFAFWVGEDFLRGTSAPCPTFNTKAPLASEAEFVVRDLECWAFDSGELARLVEAGKSKYATSNGDDSSGDEDTVGAQSRDARRSAKVAKEIKDERLREQVSEAQRFEAIT